MYRFIRYQLFPLFVLALLWFAAYEFGLLEPEQQDAPSGDAQIEAALDYSKPFTSKAGLYYGTDPSPKFNTRFDHVMAHTKPDPSKPKHSMFIEKSRVAIVALIDEAWQKRDAPNRQGGAQGRDKYQVDMGRRIGTDGERELRLIMEADSNDIVTAYPVH